jgi:hypothetical protein
VAQTSAPFDFVQASFCGHIFFLDQRLSTLICGKSSSTKSWQQHDVVLRHLFHCAAGFAPGGKSAGDYVGVESLFPEHVRHTGAGGFFYSSAVEINIFILGEKRESWLKVIWFEAN